MTADQRVLVYKPRLEEDQPRTAAVTYCDSPLDFLTRAATARPDSLVVFVEGDSLKERDAMVEFCASLRQHPITSDLPLVCVLPARHRVLLEKLRQAGVEKVAFRSREAALPTGPWLTHLGEGLDQVLAQTCPHLRHLAVDRRKEMAFCGAYRNRLVLGRDRLLEVCENPSHQSCPFFLSPHQAEASA